MSVRIGNAIIIEPEGDRVCQVCGKIDECRPYGPGGIDICFDCGMKDRAGTDKRMAVVLFGDEPDSNGGN